MKKMKVFKINGLQWEATENIIGNYKTAKIYIKKLNSQKVNGFSNWRLPTLQETVELTSTKKQHKLTKKKFGNIYIWTSTKYDTSRAWVVNFLFGSCYHLDVDYLSFVRAVRSAEVSYNDTGF